MAPSAQTVKAVTDYFASEGVSAQPLAGHGDWIGFDTTVAQAGRLFNASFSTYHHVDTGTQHIRTMAYSVPAHLKEHIELVHPMTTYVGVNQLPRVFTHEAVGSQPRLRVARPSACLIEYPVGRHLARHRHVATL
jgi:hypothetical protein